MQVEDIREPSFRIDIIKGPIEPRFGAGVIRIEVVGTRAAEPEAGAREEGHVAGTGDVALIEAVETGLHRSAAAGALVE